MSSHNIFRILLSLYNFHLIYYYDIEFNINFTTHYRNIDFDIYYKNIYSIFLTWIYLNIYYTIFTQYDT